MYFYLFVCYWLPVRPPQEQQAPAVTFKGAQTGTIIKGAPQGINTKGALHEQRHVQEPIAHRTSAKKAKPSQADTNHIVPRTQKQTIALAADMMVQQVTACLVLNKTNG